MNIYFVRHGESEFNVQKLHQHPDVKLSPQGMEQASVVAKRFLSIPVDTIISSDSLRASHTARTIGEVLGKEVISSNLLKEIKRPSDIIGFHQDDPAAVAIRAQMQEHYAQKDWRHSDEETFFDAYNRAMQAIQYIQEQKKENVLVVTHGVFMKLLVSTLMMGDQLTPALFLHIRDFLATRNTGITWCTQDEQNEWHLLTWNDHAHLG